MAAMVFAREIRYGGRMAHSEGPHHIMQPQLAKLADAAAASVRRRSHILLHANHQDQVQRLLIALEPDSYVRPHLHSVQWEMIVLLRGELDLLIFGPQAELTQRLTMSAASPVVQIPRGTCHGGLALQSQTTVLEVKPGPYRPNEFAEWAPEEGDAGSGPFLRWAKQANVGAKWELPA
jgi:cupin fold WbuC family metalloprotein